MGGKVPDEVKITEIPFDPTEVQLPSWTKSRFGNFLNIIVSCPNGHPSTLAGHWINDDGTLHGVANTDSFVCSYLKLGCQFHVNVKLLNWADHKPKSMQFATGGLFGTEEV